MCFFYGKRGFNVDKQSKTLFKKGFKLGVPIGIGYFSVSFAFGMMAISSGLSPALAVLISMSNVTSAGQFAGIQVITAGGSYIEMTLTMLMINARYFLMSLSLSQKVSKKLTRVQRALMSFCVTDEIFAVASMEQGEVTGWYWFGLMIMPYIGWSGGTLAGALISSLLPSSLQDALGIALYGMFIAIIIPAAKHSRAIVMTILIAVLVSCILYYIPLFSCISSGFAVIIVTIIAAGIMAYIAPIKEETDQEEETCISC